MADTDFKKIRIGLLLYSLIVTGLFGFIMFMLITLSLATLPSEKKLSFISTFLAISFIISVSFGFIFSLMGSLLVTRNKLWCKKVTKFGVGSSIASALLSFLIVTYSYSDSYFSFNEDILYPLVTLLVVSIAFITPGFFVIRKLNRIEVL